MRAEKRHQPMQLGLRSHRVTAYCPGKNIAPRIAAKLDVAQIGDARAMNSPDTFRHPI
jgi:electron transfer flavoprotein alpha subunit